MTALSCPPDGVTRAPHALLIVEPLSATTIPQVVVPLVLVFFTVTFAQYPVDHCDCNVSSADIVPSPLLSSFSSDTISSSSEGAPLQATRPQAIETEQ
ncbi:hypothetical protein BE17_04495 [Sorangium cellulosum]|uniref:Uncharacterized protein n=1 Tax=Sorangium cellulosum TaxID=56 RepID=A0A150R3X6_SORCE|nr:hypothetical protein BE17_04495 [Sorangium cellulosum]